MRGLAGVVGFALVVSMTVVWMTALLMTAQRTDPSAVPGPRVLTHRHSPRQAGASRVLAAAAGRGVLLRYRERRHFAAGVASDGVAGRLGKRQPRFEEMSSSGARGFAGRRGRRRLCAAIERNGHSSFR